MDVVSRSASSDGRKRRWQQHTADRRQHIIDAALTVLARDIAPGERMTAQQIATEASVHRTGLYRYFEDRTDLDTSIQRVICEDLRSELMTAVTLTGTPRDVVNRVVGSYVHWVFEHPEWARFVEQDLSTDTVSPFDELNLELSQQLEDITAAFLALVGADLGPDDQNLVGPWVSGLISGCMGAARTWGLQGENRTDIGTFVTFLADTIWMQIIGLGQSRGVNIPRIPLEDMTGGQAG
ncbi:TetR family transcriptional regulator [Rhodococcoides trifolii]|uniref:TetR family transcriptional regulator n=1 Tax=Rhodococcoides trifolii TaxID=908250 RepID=A0A917G5J6_9NOCA|nr:TetR/AcrR family transcriptional regulator [Rhodococcus trifolii]GGG24256.1 TetR family transcriptional regulator [Rhodococcus trifolii]